MNLRHLFLGSLFILAFCNCQKRNKDHFSDINTPNILFIMSDDHANKAISAYHEGLINTPNIDQIGKEGILFKNAFVTNSICAPSRAVILTGKHSHLNGIKTNHDQFDGSQVTFPKLLQENGYQTALVGKWHLKTEPTGFDYWNILPGQGDYYNPDFIDMGDTTIYQGYVTNIIADLALNWLENRNEEKPFCLMVHHKAPHRNWMPDLKHLDKYEDIKLPIPSTYNDDYTGRESLKKQMLTIKDHMDYVYDFKIPCDTCPVAEVNRWAHQSYEREMNRMTEGQKLMWENGYKIEIDDFIKASQSDSGLKAWKFQRYLEDYLRCITSVDENVGKLLDYIDRSGIGENTVVVYTSDQGFFLGEHGLFDKRYMYDESLRTPLLIRFPGRINPGITSDQLVQNLDIAPTLLDLAGISIPEVMQGKSMIPLFDESANIAWRKAIYYHFFEKGWGVDSHYGIRTDRYKIIHFYDDSDQWEFFDLKEDPVEMINLIDNPRYAKTISDLKEQLHSLQNQYKDSVNNEN